MNFMLYHNPGKSKSLLLRFKETMVVRKNPTNTLGPELHTLIIPKPDYQTPDSNIALKNNLMNRALNF